MTILGTDTSTFPGFDTTGRTIAEVRALAECCLRRLTTPAGTLEYDSSFGYDLRDLLNDDLDDVDLQRHETGAEMQLELDERIRTAEVSMALDRSTFRLTIRITGVLVDATTFNLVLAIDKVSADVLKAA